jgi:hypothetical protein
LFSGTEKHFKDCIFDDIFVAKTDICCYNTRNISFMEDRMKKLFIAAILVSITVVGLYAQTRTPVQVPGTVRSGWGKPVRYTVTAPNIIQARGTAQDMDGIILRDIPYNGQQKLVITVRSMTGRFPWDNGKMFGVKVAAPPAAPNLQQGAGFLETPGRRLMDRMIDGPFAVGDEVVFQLPADVIANPGTINIGLTIFCGATFEIALWFE